jgi:uncharacterized protein (DUF983 family)
MSDSSSHPAAPLALVAFRGRCPRCGRGSLFKTYLGVADQCDVCGLGLAGHDSGDGPAFFIMLPLCIIVAVAALLLDMRLQPPMWVHMVLWPSVILAAVLLTLRPVKAVMVALQYKHRDVEHDDSSNQQ